MTVRSRRDRRRGASSSMFLARAAITGRQEEAAVVDARPQPVQRLQMFRHARSPLWVSKRIARAIQRQRDISRSRVTLAMIEAAAIDITNAVAADHARRSRTAQSIRSRPSTNTCFGISGSALHGARQRPERGAQDVVAIDPRRRGKGDRKRRGRADLFEQFLAALRRQPLRDRRCLWGSAWDRARRRRPPPDRPADRARPRRSRPPARRRA